MASKDWTCWDVLKDLGFPQYNGSAYNTSPQSTGKAIQNRIIELFYSQTDNNAAKQTKCTKDHFYRAIIVMHLIMRAKIVPPENSNFRKKENWIHNFSYENFIDSTNHGNRAYGIDVFRQKKSREEADAFLKSIIIKTVGGLRYITKDGKDDLKFLDVYKSIKCLQSCSLSSSKEGVDTLDEYYLNSVIGGFDLIKEVLDEVNPPSPPKVVNLLETLKTSKQLILQGPPGTGKTREAKILAARLIGCKSEDGSLLEAAELVAAAEEEIKKDNPRIRMVQFHPSYGYEDFISGIGTKENQWQYKDGILKEFAQKAAKAADDRKQDADDHKQDYVLIIDEINRAPLASVLGELLYALEYRGNEITIQSSDPSNNKLSIPKNLYIIGTMNTADRSLSSMDYALRRRFAFARLNSKDLSKEDLGEKFFDGVCYERVSQLFKSGILIKGIDPEDVKPGQSYFIYDNDEHKEQKEQKEQKKHKDYKIAYELAPILMEYYKDGFFRKQAEVGGQRISEIFANTDSIVKYLEEAKVVS